MYKVQSIRTQTSITALINLMWPVPTNFLPKTFDEKEQAMDLTVNIEIAVGQQIDNSLAGYIHNNNYC